MTDILPPGFRDALEALEKVELEKKLTPAHTGFSYLGEAPTGIQAHTRVFVRLSNGKALEYDLVSLRALVEELKGGSHFIASLVLFGAGVYFR